MSFKAYFNIHGLIQLSFISDCSLAIQYVKKKYGSFISGPTKEIDLNFNISLFPKHKIKSFQRKKCEQIRWKDSRYIAKWESKVTNLNEKLTNVDFSGNVFSLKYFLMRVVEPLINTKLNFNDAILLHASGLSCNDGAFVFCSYPGTGKTSLAFKLINNPNIKFISDEFVIVTQDGRVLPFLMPIAFYDYNFQLNTKLNTCLSTTDRMNLKIKKFIRILSKDKVKIPTYIDIRRHLPNNIQSGSCELKKFFVLSKTSARHLEFQEINLSSFVSDILKINNYQFRYFNNFLQNENSPYVHASLDSWQISQRRILEKALRKSVFLELKIPSDFSGCDSDIADLI